MIRLFLTLALLSPIHGFAQSVSKPYLEFLSQVNRFSPMEGAGSHGSFGVKVGAMMQVTPRTEQGKNDIGFNLLNQNNEEDAAISAPKIVLTKGLFIPVDFGVGFGLIDQLDLQQFAGYLQWTIFEGLAMPAVAVRYIASQLQGQADISVLSHAGEAILSYGFFRFFNLYSSARYQRDEFTWEAQTGGKIRSELTGTSYSAGLEVMVLPPFTTLAVEVQSLRDDSQSYLGKLAFLF